MVSTQVTKIIQELGRIKHYQVTNHAKKTVLEWLLKCCENNDLTFVENIKSIEGVKDLRWSIQRRIPWLVNEKKSWSSRKKKLWLVICLIIITSGLYAILCIWIPEIQVLVEYTLSDKSTVSSWVMSFSGRKTVSECSSCLCWYHMEELEPKRATIAGKQLKKVTSLNDGRKKVSGIVLRFLLDYPGKSSHKDIPDWLGNEISDLGSNAIRYIEDFHQSKVNCLKIL